MDAFKEMTKAVTLRYSENIRKKYSNFFHKLNINNFWHFKTTNEGKYYYFGTNSECSEYFSENKFYLDYPYYRHPKHFHSGISFMKDVVDNNYTEIQRSLMRKYNHQHPILFMNKTHEGIEAFGFCSNNESSQQIGLLINQIPILQQFCKKFITDNQSITLSLKENQIDLAKIIGSKFYEAGPPVLPPIPTNLNETFGLDYLISKTEKEILTWVILGLSAFQISIRLNRSKRTVEHHLERLKNKLDCSSKAELIQKGRELEKWGCLNVAQP